ncbi:MAG: hypothetical protein RMK74_01635 [Myxococcales bacterium]|nr:hypothetical protein [Myxococcales bacterium]
MTPPSTDRATQQGTGQRPESVPDGAREVLYGRRPPWARGVVARWLVAVAATGAAVSFVLGIPAASRATPLALLANALVVATVLHLFGRSAILAMYIRARLRAPQMRLEIDADSVTFDDGRRVRRLVRQHVVSVAAAEGACGLGRVIVSTLDSAGALDIPACFGVDAATLADRIERWRGPLSFDPPSRGARATHRRSDAVQTEHPSRLPPASVVIPPGRRWMTRAPLVASTVALGALLTPLPEAPRPLLALLAVGLLWPLGWIVLVRRRIARRGGPLIVLTPDSLRIGAEPHAQSLPWSRVERVVVRLRAGGSLLEGPRQLRSLVVEPADGRPAITIDGDILGLPAEAVASLAMAYRRGIARALLDASDGGRGS